MNNASDSGVAWISTLIDRKLIDVHTALPGIIETFDPSTQTAKVNLAIKRIRRNIGSTTKPEREAVEIAPLKNVPVMITGGGGYHITTPISSGDECLVIFSERSIDLWQQYGGVQEPLDKRRHEYTDAFAVVGLHSDPNPIDSYSSDSLQIRNDDGSTYINVANDAIQLEINGGGATFNADKSVVYKNGAQITLAGDFITALGNSLDTHIHSGGTLPGGKTGTAE